MATVKKKVHLITEQQRNGLLKYLLDRPYREVAVAIQVLAQAPTTEVNMEVPDEQLENQSTQEESKINVDSLETSKLELVIPPAEELSVFTNA